MSSIQSFTHSCVEGQGSTYYTVKNGYLDTSGSAITHWGTQVNPGIGTMNAAGKNQLFPNSTAKPISADFKYSGLKLTIVVGSSRAGFRIDGTQLFEDTLPSSWQSFAHTVSSTTLQNATKNSTLDWYLNNSGASGGGLNNIQITFYFTRYDFSASRGTGISLAIPLSKSLVSGSVSGNTGGYSPYYGGQIAYTTLDGSKCVAITTTTDNPYPDGAIIEGTTLTVGKQYFYKVEYNAPVGKDIRIGMRLSNGGNTENVVVTGTGAWKSVYHVFTATSDMSGQLEVVENGPDATPTTFYTRNVTIKDTNGQGYDGDQLGFYAEVQDGYKWDGWYSGDTKVSSSQYYLRNVGGSDVSLQARAVPATKRLTVNYGGSNVIDKQVTPPVAITYNGTQIASVASGQTKTLNCSNKLMSSNVTIGAGGGTLLCSGKIMETNIVVVVS